MAEEENKETTEQPEGEAQASEPAADAPAEDAPAADARTDEPAAAREAGARKVRQGVVISDKGEKTITVRIDSVRRHRLYEKVLRESRSLHAHDENNEAGEGDVVRLVECRPLSRTKRW